MSYTTTSILVPIDSSERSVDALSQASSLAKHTHSKLILMAVNNTNSSALKKKLYQLAQEAYEKSGCDVETIIRFGDPHEQIQKVADVFNSLLVLGLDKAKQSLTSFTGRLAFKSECEYQNPVITIRGKVSRESYKTILLPIQLRKETREKVDRAIELAKYYDASIRIASVLTSDEEGAENKLLAYANQVWRSIKSHHIRCTIKTLRGKDAVQLILDYGHQVDADLILIINKQPINIKEYLMGTVSQQLLRGSDIPVLCFQPMERKDTSIFVPY